MVTKKFNGLKIIIHRNHDKFSIYKKSIRHITIVDILINVHYNNALKCAEMHIKQNKTKIKDGFTYFSYDNVNDKLIPSETNYDFSTSADSENDLLRKLESGDTQIILENGYYLYLNVNGKIFEYGKNSDYTDYPEIYYKKYEEIIKNLDISLIDMFMPVSNDKYVNYVGICEMFYKHLQIQNKDIFNDNLGMKNDILILGNNITNKELLSELELLDNFLYYQMLLREFKNIRFNKDFKKENLIKMQKLKAAILTKIKAKLWEF